MKTLKQQDQLDIDSVDDWDSAKHQIDKMIAQRPDWTLTMVVTFKRKTEDEKATEIIEKRQLDLFEPILVI